MLLCDEAWLIRHQDNPTNPPKGQVGAIFYQDDNNKYNSTSYHLCNREGSSCPTLGGAIHIIGLEGDSKVSWERDIFFFFFLIHLSQRHYIT